MGDRVSSRSTESKSQRAIDREVRRYLRTGESDVVFSAWPGNNIFEQAENGDRDLRAAIIAEVHAREEGADFPVAQIEIDLSSFTRNKVTPMVNGLFPQKERETVLGLLEKSVVFLHRDNIDQIMQEERWLSTVWVVANIYLSSIGAKPLSQTHAHIVGLSEETTCYVSMTYFDEDDPFADFVVHEVAHIFHNWKREYAGMPHTRRREWLLSIDFTKRETFAYSCEAYSRVLEQAKNRAERRRLLQEYSEEWVPESDDRVDWDELIDILGEAVEARNGWKRILSRCAPPKPKSRTEWIRESVEQAMKKKYGELD
jgi:hypothetical protein